MSGSISSKAALLPEVRDHLNALTLSLDEVDSRRLEAAAQLSSWLSQELNSGRGAEVVFVCTGNSRRSILGAAMGNAAAAYCELSQIRFSSAGTVPSSFNPRTIAALQAAGFTVTPASAEPAVPPPSSQEAANQHYTVRWGEAERQSAVEFSKALGARSLPESQFAAILVCAEAAQECAFVSGASVCIPMPLVDPKDFDDTPDESSHYAETRDQLGRIMLTALRDVVKGNPA